MSWPVVHDGPGLRDTCAQEHVDDVIVRRAMYARTASLRCNYVHQATDASWHGWLLRGLASRHRGTAHLNTRKSLIPDSLYRPKPPIIYSVLKKSTRTYLILVRSRVGTAAFFAQYRVAVRACSHATLRSLRIVLRQKTLPAATNCFESGSIHAGSGILRFRS